MQQLLTKIPESIVRLEHELDLDPIRKVRELAAAELAATDFWSPIIKRLNALNLPTSAPRLLADAASICLGAAKDLNVAENENLANVLKDLRPWRVGPFSIFGTEIDGEWIGSKKWDRLSPYLPSLSGKKIADVGCSSGYHLLRMLEQDPKLALGFDPSPRCWLQFLLLQRVLQSTRLAFEPIGVEQMPLLSGVFDVMLCMGVLYHQRDPILALTNLRSALAPEGVLFLETMVIPGDEELVLYPRDRYAGMRNAWCIPQSRALLNWCDRAGFRQAEIVSLVPSDVQEQRTTIWSPDYSLREFLDRENFEKTIEGYAAPWRAIVRARG